MATHFEAGGDWLQAANALRAAAGRAQQRRAFADAAELLESALRVADHLTEIERRRQAHEIGAELTIAREALNQETLLQERIPEEV
jgi:hypothetical protein